MKPAEFYTVRLFNKDLFTAHSSLHNGYWYLSLGWGIVTFSRYEAIDSIFSFGGITSQYSKLSVRETYGNEGSSAI